MGHAEGQYCLRSQHCQQLSPIRHDCQHGTGLVDWNKSFLPSRKESTAETSRPAINDIGRKMHTSEIRGRPPVHVISRCPSRSMISSVPIQASSRVNMKIITKETANSETQDCRTNTIILGRYLPRLENCCQCYVSWRRCTSGNAESV